MGLFIRSVYFNRLLLSGILVSFSLATVPQPCYSIELNLNDAAFFYKLEKIVEKFTKLKDKSDIKKIIATALELKTEIEGYYNTSLDVSQYLDAVEKEVRHQGGKFPKFQWKQIKDIFKKADKKKKNHQGWLARAAFNENDFMAYQDNFHMAAKKHDKDDSKHDKDDKDEIILPVQLVYGVTLSLVGLFLMFVPFPACKPWGEKLFLMGAGAAAQSLCTQEEKNRQDQKDKK